MSTRRKFIFLGLSVGPLFGLLLFAAEVCGQSSSSGELPFPSFSFPSIPTPYDSASSTNNPNPATQTATDASSNSPPAGSVSATGSSVSSTATPVSATLEVAETTSPPTSTSLPDFVHSYSDLENPVSASSDPVYRDKDGRRVAVPPRDRQSISAKEEAEKELESQYDSWLKNQKATQKSSKTPRYLQPLSDDREIFDNPNSPFSREVQKENDRRFVRQVTAADLALMKEVSSKRELMDWEKDQDMPVDWSKYSIGWQKWRDWLGMGPDEKEAVALMQRACEKHEEFSRTKEMKTLRDAAALYEKAGKKWPDSVLEEDALFYAAECRFFDKNYTKSLELYSALVSKYSNSVLKKDAMKRLYCIGCYWVQCSESDPSVVNLTDSTKPRFSSFAGAKKAFETIYLNDASERGYAPDALFALANAYMRRGVEQGDASFDSAARYYRQLYEYYPGSRYTDRAYQLAMHALYQSYRGPFYDDAPLKQAQEIAEIAKRSGREGINMELIDEQLELIRDEQANHLWARGEYYEKRGNFASARSYYNRLVKEYPSSELVASAINRYQAISDKPAEADQFAYVRPIMPFLPKPKTEYYEERPTEAIQLADRNGSTELSSYGSTATDDSNAKRTSENPSKVAQKSSSDSAPSPVRVQ